MGRVSRAEFDRLKDGVSLEHLVEASGVELAPHGAKDLVGHCPFHDDRLVPLRVWFRWMARHHHILHNPASELEMPRLGFRLPKAVLTANEAEQILAQPDIRDSIGLRDRAIVETFYSTGIRRLEAAGASLRGRFVGTREVHPETRSFQHPRM